MEEIIKEIVKIDSNAMENRKQQENRINERKAYYEAQIAAYEKERIEDAKEKAEKAYQDIIAAGDGYTYNTLSEAYAAYEKKLENDYKDLPK